jgi:hypothetical protein
MRKFVFVLAAATALGAGAAFANTIEAAFGNTITVTQEGAPTETYHFNADHSFTAWAGEAEVSGAWAIVDGQLCVTPQGAEQKCSPMAMDKNVGDTWVYTNAEGASATVAITPGRNR